ncbi:MAG: thiolase family protein [Oscillospiraceae bacterium]|nr:thiolase family protein [Oscillospiraceae bacterium]
MKNIVITGAVRTPVGGYLGGLKTVAPEYLASPVLAEVLQRSGITTADVDQVILGDVLSHVPNIARISALLAGYEIETPAFTVDRQCGSSLQAVVSAVQAIGNEDAEVIVAGGTESMSRAPYYLPDNVRYEGFRMGNFEVSDAFAYASSNAHPAALYKGLNMGLTAENVAKKHSISREMQDAFAFDSQRKYKEAFEAGKFKDEILPFEVQVRKQTVTVSEDEHPKMDTTLESLAELKPVFVRDGTGTVTAGNASGMNDGASAVVVMSETRAKELGCAPLVRIVATATAGIDPNVMGLGVVPATQKVLAKAGLALEDIDLFEFNEAFSAQALGCLIALGMEPGSALYERVNVNGGAVAHGHALGNSGTRILTTLIYELRRRKGRYGLASLCVGGGQGIAILVENCDY